MKSRGRRENYKLMYAIYVWLAAPFVRFTNRWRSDGLNPPSLCIQQKWCASKKKSSVPCGDIFVPSFANRQNYWHSRAAKHLKRPCLHRNLCWDFCQTFSLRNLILVDCRSEIKMGSPCLLLRYDGCEYLHQSICCQFTPSLLTIVS